jgi:hypothetical protein
MRIMGANANAKHPPRLYSFSPLLRFSYEDFLEYNPDSDLQITLIWA